MRLLFLLAVTISLASCRTTKYIDRVEVHTDSTAIRERDSLAMVKRLDSAAYSNMIEMLSNNTLEFRDTGSTRVEYYPDGSVKFVEGQVKSLRSGLSKYVHSNSSYHVGYDSIRWISSKDSAQVRTEYKTVTVTKKKSFLPWWWLVAAFIIGFALRWLIRKK